MGQSGLNKKDFKNYFGYSELQGITLDERNELIEYGISSGEIAKCLQPSGDTSLAPLVYKLPEIRGNVSKVWLDSLREGREAFDYKGVSYKDLYAVLLMDGLVQGKVISVLDVAEQNPEKCLYYKTEFVVEVTSVIHSYPEIEIGDVVL